MSTSARARQAINDYNRKVAEYNRKVTQAINDHNRKVNAHNKRVVDDYNRQVRAHSQAVDRYNSQVRAHNAQVRANRQRLAREIARLNARPTSTTRHVTYRTSVQQLRQSFTHIEKAADRGTWAGGADLLDMAEGETANSVAVLNALEETPEESGDEARLRESTITTELAEITPDLDARWRGALFALSPVNPDAARQFCTSAREILVKILDLKAPDKKVLEIWPDAKRTPQNQVMRREKIRFCLAQSGQQDPQLAAFVDDDINNVMDLFGVFNPATHGEAGKYNFAQLSAIKTRVEGAIQFLHRIVRGY